MSQFVKFDRLKQVLQGILDVSTKKVLVGIPDGTTDRTDDDQGPMNNATLGYIHENGSPAANIPARPWLVPGIEDAQDAIAERLKKASQAALDRKPDRVKQQLESAGRVAEKSAKNKINEGAFEPLKPSTIANRKRSRKTKSMRKSEKEYIALIASGAQAAGMSLSEIQDAAGIKPLVNTGGMRNAVIYVIRG